MSHRNPLKNVSKDHVINLFQADVAFHEMTQISRQQVLNLIATDVTDDGPLAAQGPFEPYVLSPKPPPGSFRSRT